VNYTILGSLLLKYEIILVNGRFKVVLKWKWCWCWFRVHACEI